MHRHYIVHKDSMPRISSTLIILQFGELSGLRAAPSPDILEIKQFVRVSDPDNITICQINRALFHPAILKVLQFDRV